MAIRAHYSLHGWQLTVESPSRALLETFDAVLGAYSTDDGRGDRFRVSLSYGPPAGEPDAGLRDFWTGALPDGTPLICRSASGRRQFEVPGRLRTDIDLAGCNARVTLQAGGERSLLEACVLPILCDALGEAGHHVVHAASLFMETGGRKRALIISGKSGTGKTTLALALAGAGFGLLADDMTFSTASGQAARVWGIRTRCKVCPQTSELLPWLKQLPACGAGARGESFIDARQFGAPTTGVTASPGLLLLLNPRNASAHRIEPVDKLTALTRLVRENVRAFEPHRQAASGRAFGALAELVRSSRTFQASLCPRLEELPQRLASLWSECS
jgi:hypothetical protein